MIIESVEVRHISMKLQHPFETSFGVEVERECLILELKSEGIIGWGECAAGRYPLYNYETVQTAWHVLTDFFIPSILSKEVRDIEAFRRSLSRYQGHNLAKAGLELAMWDILSQREGKSLAAFIGGPKEKVEVGVSIGIQANVKALLDRVESFVDQGYQRVKIKIKPGRDLEEISAVRNAYPNLAIQVDANTAYTLSDAKVLKRMDAFELLFIEQPLAEYDLLDHSRLQAQLQTSICLDESILSTHHAQQAIDIGACKVINIKQARVGGLDEALKLHNFCFETGVPVWCGGLLETGIGRAANLALASLPGFRFPGDISATDRYYEQDIAEPNFVLNPDSTINVPEGPGLGVKVLPREMKRYTLRSEVFRH